MAYSKFPLLFAYTIYLCISDMQPVIRNNNLLGKKISARTVKRLGEDIKKATEEETLEDILVAVSTKSIYSLGFVLKALNWSH